MRTKKPHSGTNQQGRQLVLMSLQKQVEMRKFYVARIPKWRHPLVGYLLGIPLVGLTLLGAMWEQRVLPHFYFSGGPLLLAVMLIALIWGVGPAIFSALLGALALLYLYIPPFGIFDLNSWKNLNLSDWNSLLPILPFFISGIIIAIITSQRESARQRALFAEQEEQERASELEATFEAIADSVIVYDLLGRVLQTNAAARRLFALETKPAPALKFSLRSLLSLRSFFLRRKRVEQVEQKPVMVILDEQGQPLPEGRGPLARILSGEELTDANAMDVVIRTFDGHDVHLNVTGASVYNPQGQPVGAVCVFRDVTERRELEQRTHHTLNALLEMAETLVKLPHDTDLTKEPPAPVVEEYMPAMAIEEARRLAELVRSVLGCQRVGIIALNPETDVLHPLVVVGLTPEQELQWWHTQKQYIHMSDSPYPDHISRLRKNEVLVLDMMRPPFNSQPNLSSVRTMLVAPMFVGDQLVGTLTLDYGTAKHEYSAEEIALSKAVARLAALVIERERLVYERAKARASELALRESNRRMDEFLGMAGHELRTPLTTIKGNIQLAKRQLKKNISPGELSAEDLSNKLKLVEELLERAERQVRLQNRLVGDLLDVSRIQAGKIELNMEPCNLITIVREAVQDQSQLASSRTICLNLPSEEIVPVVADADRIGQVVTNYLTNALKYSAAAQPVEVSLQVEEKLARVSVRDEGPGLSAEEQQYIWERFHQVERIKVQSGSSGGLGLGLHICRTIVERHQGQVGVESAPGEGSTFWFTLPLALDAPVEQ
jgi:signal transduction histidine kinase/PAS domain-containing protein